LACTLTGASSSGRATLGRQNAAGIGCEAEVL
jgi:hypothetical protein